jgi:hypothetical protein
LAFSAPAGAEKPQAITIQSWLLRLPDADGGYATAYSRGTVLACFRITGAIDVSGGGPTWNDATYASTADLAGKCTDWTLAGDYVFRGEGHLQPQRLANGLPFILFARHTLKVNETDSMFIQFVGEYTPTATGFPGEGNWVITGGTGAYAGVQGTGTWVADGATFPYFVHTEYGSIHFTGTGG